MHPAIALLSPVLLIYWYYSASRKRLLENVPTSKVKGVFLGQVEVKGRAVPIEPLRSYLAGVTCVYYSYSIEERWSRQVTETDSEGNRRTRTESGRRTVASGGEGPPFMLRDRTGELRVDPKGAEVHGTTVFDETVGMFDPIYYTILIRNGLVSVRERALMAKSLIDVQLRRRHVLIPRLAEVVRAVAEYEKKTQEDVAAARAGDAASQTRALRSLFGLVESCPELKAAENFQKLHEELVDTEDRIALAREFHNQTITALNNRIEMLPDALVAKLTLFRRGRLYEAEGFERTAMSVNLDADA